MMLAPAFGQDTEPNNSCAAAQDLGPISMPFSLDGELYPSPVGDPFVSPADVDYYRFTATPGTLIQIDHTRGTLSDPILGSFDPTCTNPYPNYVDFDGGGWPNARLRLEVPASGEVVVAASAYFDYGYYFPPFSGLHYDQGTYTLTVTQVPLIGSIGGQALDAVFGGVLRGDVAPFAVAELQRCDGFGYCYAVASQNTDSAGRFRFERDFSNSRLEAGTFRVRIGANEYQAAQSAAFAVAEGQDFIVPDLLVAPFPVKISEIRPCGDMPPEGGTCRFSFRVRNQMATPLTGKAWSLVENGATGSFISYTRFQAGTQGLTNLATGASKVTSFSFRVPTSLTDGSFVCATAYVGQGTDAYFAPVGSKEPLFCILKGFTGGAFSLAATAGTTNRGGYRVLSEEESQKLYHRRRQDSGSSAVLTIPAVPAPSN